MEPATVVIDNGTGYTKMGYDGNMEPSYLIPSYVATHVNKVSDFFFSWHLTISSLVRAECRHGYQPLYER